VAGEAEDAPGPAGSGSDSSLEVVRDILLRHQRQRIDELEAGARTLRRRLEDKDALIATITPVLGDAIRRRIGEAREEMIEALYPIIGQLVARAVSEAVRDLARKVDAQVRTSFNPRLVWWRIRARLGGASGAEAALRQALPFQVIEVFLVHRQTGLLLRHLSREPADQAGSEVIGGMLTAIRDFAADAFGRGIEGQLDEIEYGERRILIEAAQHAYVAVVVDGIEPPGYRELVREKLIDIQHAEGVALEQYDGDPESLVAADEPLRALMQEEAAPPRMSRGQVRLIAGLAALLVLCAAVTCLAGRWVWQVAARPPAQVQVIYITVVAPTFTPPPTASLTPVPTSTATPTATQSPSPTLKPPTSTASPTATSVPTETPMPSATQGAIGGTMRGSAWLFPQPPPGVDHTSQAVARGEPVEVLARYGIWCLVRSQPSPSIEFRGWLACRWVEMAAAIPPWLITPVP
jgi:hypothetical protein